MADNVVEFTDASFESDVLNGEGLVMVDFWAPWCGPCRMLGPTIEELAGEYAGKVKIGKLNTDSNRQAAMNQDIRALPTVRLYKDGVAVETIVGVPGKDKFVQVIEKHA